MTEVDLLTAINEKLQAILDRWTWLQSVWEKGTTWVATPAGEFGFMARFSYGEFLLALLGIGFGTVWLIRQVQKVVSPGGWW